MKSEIKYLLVCGLCASMIAVMSYQPVSAFWGRTWNGPYGNPCGNPCAGPACYPAFRPFGGLLHGAFCTVFPCRCHAWNACPPMNPCFDPCYTSYSYSDYCCDSGVLIDQPMSRPVPDRVISSPNAGTSRVQSPNVRPDTLNKGNFHQNPTLSPLPSPNPNSPQFPSMPNTSAYGAGTSNTFGDSTNTVTVPLERTPPQAVEDIITTDFDETTDPASRTPYLPSDNMPAFGGGTRGEDGGYMPDVPVPPTGSSPSPSLPTPPTRPGSGAGKINLGTGVISVNVPENAKVYINGYETRQTGTHRTYVSNGLTSGQDYRYEIHVVANVGGRWIEETKQMLLTADEHALLSFSAFDKVRPAFPSMNMQLTARAE